MRKYLKFWVMALALAMAPAAIGASIDIVLVVDESGSMGGEHTWLPGMVTDLDTQLSGLGYTANYALIGYGGPAVGGRKFLVGGNDFGTAAQFGTAAANLVTSGGTEDGYAALNFAFNNLAFTSGAARNYILVTDEDRDIWDNGVNKPGISGALSSQNALLNVVVNNSFNCGQGGALGRTTGSGYSADGSGGFTECATPFTGSGSGTTSTDYVDLALTLGGAAWDLNQLRAGGLTAQSFTAAFVNIKVEEIQKQLVPEPSSFVLAGAGLIGLVWFQRRRRAS